MHIFQRMEPIELRGGKTFLRILIFSLYSSHGRGQEKSRKTFLSSKMQILSVTAHKPDQANDDSHLSCVAKR